ncbi:MAG: hypothetical protein WC579_00100 [Candidatus Paceibacterota bacterium]|nr:hypothetical protein [Candidatus Paceibacterota bacterium]HQM34905.1 hypothetical protein [Candidatus Paceibacterota bacterium]
MNRKVRFLKWTPQTKIDAVIALGMGFKRDFTDISDQTKSICSTAALISIQNNIPLVLVGQEMDDEQEETAKCVPNESVKMYRFVRYLHTEQNIVEKISQLNARSLYGKLDTVLELVEKTGWEKIAIICHVDMMPRIKKVLKQLGLMKEVEVSVYLAPIRPMYNGDSDFWWLRENWRAKLYEMSSSLFNLINR